MPIKAKVNLQGFSQYFETLRKAGANLEAAADRALLQGAKVLQEGMISRAPVDTHNLAEHIKIKGPYKDGGLHYVDVGLIHDRAYTDAETMRYGIAQEYGWITTDGKGAPQPYIRPTIDSDMGAARRAMRDSLKREGVVE